MKSSFSWSIGSGETSSGKTSGGLTGPKADSSGNGKQLKITRTTICSPMIASISTLKNNIGAHVDMEFLFECLAR